MCDSGWRSDETWSHSEEERSQWRTHQFSSLESGNDPIRRFSGSTPADRQNAPNGSRLTENWSGRSTCDHLLTVKARSKSVFNPVSFINCFHCFICRHKIYGREIFLRPFRTPQVHWGRLHQSCTRSLSHSTRSFLLFHGSVVLWNQISILISRSRFFRLICSTLRWTDRELFSSAASKFRTMDDSRHHIQHIGNRRIHSPRLLQTIFLSWFAASFLRNLCADPIPSALPLSEKKIIVCTTWDSVRSYSTSRSRTWTSRAESWTIFPDRVTTRTSPEQRSTKQIFNPIHTNTTNTHEKRNQSWS